MGKKLPSPLAGCRKIGLIGLGISNRGVLSHIRECDGCPEIRTIESIQKTQDTLCDFSGADALVLSPSVRPDALALTRAKARGVRILTDGEIFFTDTKARCFAVTGSDGKSTTTAMLAHLLSAALGKEVPAIGNIGQAMTPRLAEDHTDYAIELSSFQLFHYTPHVARAAITNLTENHLNWHKGMEEYKRAKAGLYAACDNPIVSPDGIGAYELLKKQPFAVYSMEKTEKELAKCKAEFAYYIKNEMVYENGAPFLPLSYLKADTSYNRYNLLCALAMAAGIITKESARAIEDFSGLAHRCRCVLTVRGVRYIDSSIDSSPSRTAKTLGALDAPVVLLLGGLGKGLSLTPLLAPVKEKCRGVVCFGPFGREAAAFLAENGYAGLLPSPTERLAEAFYAASDIAREGDAVLLSPAATSFDEFENFEARADAFRALALSLINKSI